MNSEHQKGIVTGNGAMTEQALRASELSYRRLFEAARDGILILDVETGRISDVNPFLIDLLGFSHSDSEMVGKTVGEVGLFKNNGSNKIMFERLQKDGYIRCDNLPLETSDGRKIAVELIGNVYQAGDKKMIQCHIRDVPERRQVEGELKLFRALIERSNDAIHVVNPATGRFLDVNESACRALGYTRDEHLVLTVFDVVEVDRTFFYATIARAKKAGHARVEVLHRRKDGTTFPVEVSLSPITIDREYLLAVVRDITERKRAEAAVREGERRFQTLADTSPVGIFRTNGQGQTIYVNPRWCQISGLSATNAMGEGWLRAVHPDDQERLAQGWQAATRAQNISQTDYRFVHPDGTVSWVMGQAVPEKDDAGNLVGYVGTITDITERKRAEDALRGSEMLLKETQTIAGLGSYVMDIPTGSWRSSDMLHKVFGIDKTYECSVEGWKNLIHPDDRTVMMDYLRNEVLDRGRAFDKEYRIIRHNDQAERWVHGLGRLEFDAQGRRVKMLGTIQDITDSKRAEKALQLFKFATDRAADAVFWMNRDGSFFYVNDEACRSLGYARNELMRLRLFDIDPDFSKERWKENWLRFEHNEMATNRLESTQRRKDGSTFPVEVTTRHFSTDGVDVRVAFVRDITERKRVEESQARLATAVEQAAETIMITDTRGTILYANPAFEKTSGHTRAEALGQNPRIAKSGQHDAEFYRRMWEVLGRGEVWSGHFTNRRKDGKIYDEEATISPIRDAAGKIVSYVAVKRDVTREMQLEAQFHQAQKMEAVGQLAGGVAHDFNNILGVIIGYGELIAEDLEPDSPLRKYAEEIRQAAERAKGLTQQLLIFSRKQKVQQVVLDLNETVKNLEKMLRRLIGENIEMTVVPGSEIGRIKADTGYIGQVLMNLTVNARDAMPHGGKLTITTGNVTLDENCTRTHQGVLPGSYVTLTVSDTGTGMTPEVKARIFEALFTTKPAGKGTGLGLATCHSIVQQSGGHIEVDTEVGKGTTFKIYFPRVDKPVETAVARDQTGPLPRGTETLLIVEDEAPVRHLAWKVLESLGYHVLRAGNGQDALNLARDHKGSPIRLVVTDVVMPRMGGKVMADWLKTIYPDLKILFTSGYTDDALEQEGVLEPGVAFLPKPYAPAILARKVRAMLDNETDTARFRKRGTAIHQPPAGST
jgi:PAS domain S-box-containing protein